MPAQRAEHHDRARSLRFSLLREQRRKPKAERRQRLEAVMHEHYREPAKEVSNALPEYATKKDDRLLQIGDRDRIDDKTVFMITRN